MLITQLSSYSVEPNMNLIVIEFIDKVCFCKFGIEQINSFSFCFVIRVGICWVNFNEWLELEVLKNIYDNK